ncbi:hypothetical protein CICLE_v10017830mg [Citrus x clementina]|uniref:non-specific serine/threonine protein kinase n=1 Tax=Citrus clementina TaxID=85681 RepID=V4UH21_CITCL|nr:hypothetical protein CICLE_v10017830mg [Citrus x clementina]
MSSEEASIFSTFLFCLLMFVFSTSEIEARKLEVQMCSFSCGDVRNISYPFRLKGDPAGCGHPELELSCENNKTILELSNSARYYVKRISHDKCTISVADVNLANGSCGLPYKSFSLYPYFFRHINGYILKSYAHYVNCSSNIIDQAYTKVPCLSNNQSNVYVYVGHVGYVFGVIYQAMFWPSMGNWISFLLVDVPIIGRFILAPIVFLVFLIQRYRKSLKRVDNVEKFLHNQQSWMPKRYSYPEIIAVTNHFTHKLGQGGFGSVYKGQLHTGRLIAVKMLENSKFSGEEFINEVSTIGRIHHVNVVQLLGFCSEGSKRALVYEYMPNGSLDRHIFPKESRGQSFSWEKLHEVALGTARGIEYLHNGCDVCILHFDIKPHNILLDHNFIPKVSDFGLAKFHPKENDFVSISATRGTVGYIAPELISRNFGNVSCKSDVYGFGVVLLEMAGGRRNSNMHATRSSKAYFPSWVYD